jgi:hypothetical protein
MIESINGNGGGGGDDAGVVGFTPSQNTVAPNNTVNASRLLVDATSTNADAVVQPKGTGAFQLQLADGTATGGNKRGANAVDLQTSRGTAAQVASGNRSAVLYGLSTTASGAESLAGGNNCLASASNSIALGSSATASGNNSVAIGNQVQAQGASSTAFGLNSWATGVNSTAIGEMGLADRIGMLAYASGAFVVRGDAQREEYVLRRQTTDATATELTANNASGSATNRMSIATDSAYAFSALIVGRATAANDNSAGYKIEGVIDNNAGTTAFVGTPSVTVLGEDTAGWDVAAVADDTNDALVIQVTGAAATTIRWVASVRLVKVTG